MEGAMFQQERKRRGWTGFQDFAVGACARGLRRADTKQTVQANSKANVQK